MHCFVKRTQLFIKWCNALFYQYHMSKSLLSGNFSAAQSNLLSATEMVKKWQPVMPCLHFVVFFSSISPLIPLFCLNNLACLFIQGHLIQCNSLICVVVQNIFDLILVNAVWTFLTILNWLFHALREECIYFVCV